MELAVWIIGCIAVLILIGVAMARQNRRTCMQAFGEGYLDITRLNETQITEKFKSYLKPIRPMDAAAYTAGVQTALRGVASWEELKLTFLKEYSNGEITRCGTEIRKMDVATALSFFWAASGAIWHNDTIKKHPDLPILGAIQLDKPS